MSEATYKAAKYIRLSYTDEKTSESDSVGNQRRLIDDFLKNHPDIEAVSEKVDLYSSFLIQCGYAFVL